MGLKLSAGKENVALAAFPAAETRTVSFRM